MKTFGLCVRMCLAIAICTHTHTLQSDRDRYLSELFSLLLLRVRYLNSGAHRFYGHCYSVLFFFCRCALLAIIIGVSLTRWKMETHFIFCTKQLCQWRWKLIFCYCFFFSPARCCCCCCNGNSCRLFHNCYVALESNAVPNCGNWFVFLHLWSVFFFGELMSVCQWMLAQVWSSSMAATTATAAAAVVDVVTLSTCTNSSLAAFFYFCLVCLWIFDEIIHLFSSPFFGVN